MICYTLTATIYIINEQLYALFRECSGSRISRGLWLPQVLHLTACDYYFWRVLNNKVSSNNITLNKI